MTDLINGLFELFGGILLCLNIRRLYKDKKVTGVSWIPVAFFTSWGLWNLYFYPALNCWASFAGGIVVVTANAAWLGMSWWYCWWKPRHHPIVGQKVEVKSGEHSGESFTVKVVQEDGVDLLDPCRPSMVAEIREEEDKKDLDCIRSRIKETYAESERIFEKARQMQVEHFPIGTPGLRDPDAPCEAFEPDTGKRSYRGCEGDGHYMCFECAHKIPEEEQM